MAAKVSELAEEVLEKAAQLSSEERKLVVIALMQLPERATTPADRHAVIAERVRRVHAGDVATSTMEEVEQRLRAKYDF